MTCGHCPQHPFVNDFNERQVRIQIKDQIDRMKRKKGWLQSQLAADHMTCCASLPTTAQGLDFTLGCDSEDDETVNPRLLDEGEEGGTLRVGGAV